MRCLDRGWFESWHAGGGSYTPSLMQCPHGCNISGYSKEVQRRLRVSNITEWYYHGRESQEKPIADVIPLFERGPK